MMAHPIRREEEKSEMAEVAVRTRTPYDRIARLYELLSSPMEAMGVREKRRRLLARARGRTLEVGIGTGKSIPHYPRGVRLFGIDLSAPMLRELTRRGRGPAFLARADVRALPFPDSSFDTVVSCCVFCSVRDPVAGLEEIRRVLKPGGFALFLEHVRPRGRIAGLLADLLSPLTRTLLGFELNRRTEENLTRAGLLLLEVRREGIWREIVATGG